MGDGTKIEWTDTTWNPVVGCQVVSPGCTNCYAMKMAGRLEAMGVEHYAGMTQKTKAGFVWTGKIAPAPPHIVFAPLTWRKPRKVFVNSMSDLFTDGVPVQLIDQVWAVMALTPWNTYQILTKRPEWMREYVEGLFTPEGLERLLSTWVDHPTGRRQLIEMLEAERLAKPLPNVWLGVSTEDQARWDERVPHLHATPAAIRFISAEPMLGPIDPTRTQAPRYVPEDHELDWKYDALTAGSIYEFEDSLGVWESGDGPDHPGLDLVIVGGESGPGARPMHPDWVRDMRDACANADVAFFFKQWGEWAPGDAIGIVADGPISYANGHIPDWMDRGVTLADGSPRRLRGYSFTPHATDLVYRVGKGMAGRLLDGVEHNAMPEVARG